MRLLHRDGHRPQRLDPEGQHGQVDAEGPLAQGLHHSSMGEPVESSDEVGAPSEGLGAAGTKTQLEGQLDGVYRRGAARGIDVPGECTSEGHSRWTEQG
ncbi:hypothetical protein PO878_04445 [Iamia majanohamensis]|uniref:Uncharacterized protein n=1 Tax=Iamia majanohamensis TaxID=467976 RepID=A0AAF0BUM5_9ACTN|nr:hypothetical protein [Iamia majanohamensis]WCO67972.1 hypothetical protein PO878_04445 [Iamia majanohamensis]